MGEGRGRLWGGGVRRVGGRELGGSRRERRFWREWWYGGLVGEGRWFGRGMGRNGLRGSGGVVWAGNGKKWVKRKWWGGEWCVGVFSL